MTFLSTKGAVWVNGLRRQLFPPTCLFCHRPLPEGDGCCVRCLDGIRSYPKQACVRCGVPLPASLAPGPCGHCLRRPPPQLETHSLFLYQEGVRSALLEWKLAGNDAAVHWLLRVATPHIMELIGRRDLLLPVPMPLSRMRRRGQHHAADLCRQVAMISTSSWDWHLLRRVGKQRRQSELSGSARRRNLRRAFLCRKGTYPLHDVDRIWLIDDIITTGATVYHAARSLKPLGKPVHVLSLARTPASG